MERARIEVALEELYTRIFPLYESAGALSRDGFVRSYSRIEGEEDAQTKYCKEVFAIIFFTDQQVQDAMRFVEGDLSGDAKDETKRIKDLFQFLIIKQRFEYIYSLFKEWKPVIDEKVHETDLFCNILLPLKWRLMKAGIYDENKQITEKTEDRPQAVA